MNDCVLCRALTEDSPDRILWQDALCRVVLVGGDEGRDFPGFCRVICHAHVTEMSMLAPDRRSDLMDRVFATEQAIRTVMKPDKINLASLGNVVPHLHWHVIPRWRGDSRFPAPVWNPACRAGAVPSAPAFEELRTALQRALAELHVEV